MTDILQFIKKQFSFKGRAGRTELWTFFMVVWVIISFFNTLEDSTYTFYILSSIFSLSIIIPFIFINIRRLHDLNLNGIWLLFFVGYTLVMLHISLHIQIFNTNLGIFIALISFVPSCYLAFAPGKTNDNPY